MEANASSLHRIKIMVLKEFQKMFITRVTILVSDKSRKPAFLILMLLRTIGAEMRIRELSLLQAASFTNSHDCYINLLRNIKIITMKLTKLIVCSIWTFFNRCKTNDDMDSDLSGCSSDGLLENFISTDGLNV
jgi:hypothetical protein